MHKRAVHLYHATDRVVHDDVHPTDRELEHGRDLRGLETELPRQLSQQFLGREVAETHGLVDWRDGGREREEEGTG